MDCSNLNTNISMCIVWIPIMIATKAWLKASFWGLFKTNFYGHFHKLFVFTKFNFSKFREKLFLILPINI